VGLDLLARKGWTCRALTVRLGRRGAPAAVATAVVAEFTARGYLDDAQFARRWVESRAAGRGLGPVRLRRELLIRGVDPALADAAIRDTFPGEAPMPRALEAGRRYWLTLRKRDPQRAPSRLRDFLLRRGYAAGVAERVVRTLCDGES
jgi:regulatory protein